MMTQPLTASMPEQLKGRLELLGHCTGATLQRETVRALTALVRLYDRRSFQPIWVCEAGCCHI
jgi:hypothetical protein